MAADPANPLAALKDIHEAPPVPWWPPAPGWWVLAFIVLLFLIWLAIKWLRHWRQVRFRRRIIAEINALPTRHADDPRAAVGAINAMLKRVALRHFGRSTIAPLFGDRWLEFLNQHGPGSNAPEELSDARWQREFKPESLEAISQWATQWVRAYV